MLRLAVNSFINKANYKCFVQNMIKRPDTSSVKIVILEALGGRYNTYLSIASIL